MAESRVTSKGRITIPAEIRRAIGLKPHDRVIFTLTTDGTTVMRAKSRSLTDLAGSLQEKVSCRVAVKDMRIGD